jgi:hypothetical protein
LDLQITIGLLNDATGFPLLVALESWTTQELTRADVDRRPLTVVRSPKGGLPKAALIIWHNQCSVRADSSCTKGGKHRRRTPSGTWLS